MLQLDLSTVPVLITERLSIRPLQEEDAHAVLEIRSNPKVMAHIGKAPARTVDDSPDLLRRVEQARQDGSAVSWGITMHHTDKVIGMIGFYRLQLDHYRGEVGFTLHPDHWRKGIMSEALQAVIHLGFQRYRFHSIEAITDPLNAEANGLLQANGFIREGLFKENYFAHGRFYDSAVYSILAASPTDRRILRT